MGVIQRQGIKHSIVNFTGLAIATLSTIFIYAQKDLVEAYGLIQYLLSIAVIGFPLFSMASGVVAVRFFPNFQNKDEEHHGFLPLLLLMSLASWSVFALLAALNWDWIKTMLAHDSPLLQQYLWLTFPLTLFYTLSVVLYQYCFNFKRIVVPSILVDFAFKVVLPAVLIALLLGWIDLHLALLLLLVHYFLVLLGLVLYLRNLGELFWRPNWSFLKPELRRDIGKYAGFGMLSGLALLLATKADTLMVGSLTSMKTTGIYAIALNIAAAMDIPNKSLLNASVSFVAKYLAEENWTEMRSLYQKVSINLLTAGLLIFGCIWVSVQDLYALMPNTAEIAQGMYVLLLLSIAKLVDLGAGLNNQIVYYSKFYRFSLVSLSVLAVANVGFNLWLIPLMGLTGAAVAALLSISAYNLFNLVLVWKKFGMQPFSRQTVVVVLLAVVGISAVWFLPSTGYPFLNIVLRSGLFVLVFAGLVIRLRVSEDIDGLWRGFLNKMRHLKSWE